MGQTTYPADNYYMSKVNSSEILMFYLHFAILIHHKLCHLTFVFLEALIFVTKRCDSYNFEYFFNHKFVKNHEKSTAPSSMQFFGNSSVRDGC